jgi:hypothetical protein
LTPDGTNQTATANSTKEFPMSRAKTDYPYEKFVAKYLVAESK